MIKLHRGDCLEYMKQPDKSIDLTITDPPYGINADKGTNGYGSSKNRRYTGGWDKQRPSKEIFDEILRVSKSVIIFGGNYFCDLLPPSREWVFWDKKGEHKFKNPFSDGELIYTSFDKVVKKVTFVQQGFITDSKDKRYHPTQKPSELVERLIQEYCKEESCIIFDPFMGSGTTGVAAVSLDRNFIGCEIDKEYYKIAKQRIQEARK